MQPVVLFAPVGPYTDPISQLVWALFRQRNMAVVEAHVVVDKRGLFYVETEMLKEGRVLDQLRAKLGPAIVDRAGFHIHEARRSDGEMVQDDVDVQDGKAYLETLWTAARSAIESAGERPVVFGLVAGRRRTMTALQTSFFQLLSRRQDLLVDVRASDPRVNNYEFFFPEQDDPIEVGAAVIDPKKVDVILVDLDIPRLGGLLPKEALIDYDHALRAGQRAVDAASPPRLEIDLVEGLARVDGERLGISSAELMWFAYLASKGMADEEAWVLIGQESHDAFREFMVDLGARQWVEAIRTKPLNDLQSGEYVPDEDLRNLRGKTVQKIKKWCARYRPGAERWLVPESDGGRHQRIPLPAERLVIRR